MSNHTPTPWRVTKAPHTGRWVEVFSVNPSIDVAHAVGEANARLIVTAVNNHHELVEALRGLLSCDVDHRTEVKPGTSCKCVMAAETILERVGGGV